MFRKDRRGQKWSDIVNTMRSTITKSEKTKKETEKETGKRESFKGIGENVCFCGVCGSVCVCVFL